MGGCLEGLREAQAQISACTKSLDLQEGAMLVDGLVEEVRKNLLESRGDQIECVVRMTVCGMWHSTNLRFMCGAHLT